MFRPGASWRATYHRVVLYRVCVYNHGDTGLDQHPVASIAGILPASSAPDSSRSVPVGFGESLGIGQLYLLMYMAVTTKVSVSPQ